MSNGRTHIGIFVWVFSWWSERYLSAVLCYESWWDCSVVFSVMSDLSKCGSVDRFYLLWM